MLYTVVSPAEIFMQPPAEVCEHEAPFGCVICSKTEKARLLKDL